MLNTSNNDLFKFVVNLEFDKIVRILSGAKEILTFHLINTKANI